MWSPPKPKPDMLRRWKPMKVKPSDYQEKARGWLSKSWCRFGYPKYYVLYYSRDPKRAHNLDNYPRSHHGCKAQKSPDGYLGPLRTGMRAVASLRFSRSRTRILRHLKTSNIFHLNLQPLYYRIRRFMVNRWRFMWLLYGIT